MLPNAGTKAPWASSPATGSPFPQLARPDPVGRGVISSSSKADRMSPTAAPWVAAPNVGPSSSQLMTGKPVQGERTPLATPQWLTAVADSSGSSSTGSIT
jgi:hypothetical protein